MKFSSALGALALPALTVALDLRGYTLQEHPDPVKRAELQDIVTWDERSIFVNGERVVLFSGEVHPFRLPVHSLWLDVFQKLRAAGFNGVSFYTDWALHEGKKGEFQADGIFDLKPFFAAAKKAGIHLIARPGPYINAEVSGGGFPGWMQRVKSPFRAYDGEYLATTDLYMKEMSSIMAEAQITNGGPIILYQPENEYSFGRNGHKPFPDGPYMQYIIDQARDAGIVVPMISNDAHPNGYNAPGTGLGEVDIYGYDAYPLGFDCGNPTYWQPGKLPTNWKDTHLRQSPNTPHSVLEFQAGSYDPWGGPGFDECAKLLNHEFVRVFNKNNFGFGITVLNLYMTFGGTNWGNLGYPRGYTSYDYGASVNEDRSVAREKYSETKLLAHFIKASPAFASAVPGNSSSTAYTSTTDLTVTPVKGEKTGFWVLRHTAYESTASTEYTLKLPTSEGTLTIPQLGGKLTLNGRDSKIHVTDFEVGDYTVLYSTAEVFAAGTFGGQQTLILFGGPGEHHELAVKLSASARGEVVLEADPESSVETAQRAGNAVISWDVSEERQVVTLNGFEIILLGRNAAYNHWVADVDAEDNDGVIVNGPYVVRGAEIKGKDVKITADFNQTTTVEVLGTPPNAKNLFINGKKVQHTVDKDGVWSTGVEFDFPGFKAPDFKGLEWNYVDSLPEIKPGYDDSAWTDADVEKTFNDYKKQATPTSLFSGDYGYHSGILLYRGHFKADGSETSIKLWTQGGWAFASSVWLDDEYLGSAPGSARTPDNNSTWTFPASLSAGSEHVLTVVLDNQGYELNPFVGQDEMKQPRGILDYTLSGRDAAAITWKLTGNLGGEDYQDRTRGPSNEGGTFVERQGYHQPRPPTHERGWSKRNPITTGVSEPGIGFFAASFDLDLPRGWDVPLYFTFANSTAPPAHYRAQLFVNGYNFGRYVNQIGPQKAFHVPEGILNYRGKNWIGLTVWSQQEGPVKLDGLTLEAKMPVLTGYGKVESVPQPSFKRRRNAY